MSAKQQARRIARRAAHAGVLQLPRVHEVITCNDDYTDRWTDVPALARNRDAVAIGAQESKGIDYRKRLGQQFGVRQRMDNDATAGVAVVWNRSLASAIGSATDRPGQLGSGWLPLVVPRRGDDMLTRGVAWQDLTLRAYYSPVRVASAHRPKKTLDHLWTQFDDQLEALVDASPIPVIVCMDANESGGPNIDGRWAGIGIDGFLVRGLWVPSTYELAKARSDHRPLSAAVRLRPTRARR